MSYHAVPCLRFGIGAEASDAEDTLLRTKSASLLIPRGLDLPPSMRAPRYPTLLKQLQQEEQQRKKHEGATRRGKETSRNGSSAIEIEVGNDESGDASTVAKRTAGVMERVPWLGIGAYSGGVGGGQVVPTAEVEVATKTPGSMQTIASVESCIGDRVQWFPRSVPMEMAKSEGGYVSKKGETRGARGSLFRSWLVFESLMLFDFGVVHILSNAGNDHRMARENR